MYRDDSSKESNKRRYRDKQIKARIKEETGGKCIYCESKVGHNTPGDVEHMRPISKCKDSIYEWENLTLACSECNRRKLDYFDRDLGFLNPYEDDVESLVVHYGPLVSWRSGSKRAEVTVRILELNAATRTELILRKIEKIEEVDHLIERWENESCPVLKALLERQINRMMDQDAEFSGMVASVLETNNISIGEFSSSAS